MENAMQIASVLGPVYLVLGLSMLLYVKPWGKVLSKWSKDHYSLMAIMLMQLVLGLIVINMYNVWEFNVWLIVTISGWGMFLKGVFYFLFPGNTFTDLVKNFNNNGMLYFGGLIATLAGAALTYYVYLV